jgi:hypothetical protein
LGGSISFLGPLAPFRNLRGGWVLLSMSRGSPEAKQDGEHGKQAAGEEIQSHHVEKLAACPAACKNKSAAGAKAADSGGWRGTGREGFHFSEACP